MRTLAGIANGYGEHLVHRAADVVLKERRRLVLVVRETPLSEVHLENMLKLARMGVSIVPPMPAFYNHPQTVDDIVNHIVARVLDQFEIRRRSPSAGTATCTPRPRSSPRCPIPAPQRAARRAGRRNARSR